MYISEVIEKVGITRKACLYYEEKNLIKPKYDSNGYRVYDGNDLKKLMEIKIYRKLGLTVLEIENILSSDIKQETLRKIYLKKRNNIKLENKKIEILKNINELSIESINIKLESLEKNNTIKTKLLDKFPDFYSRILFIHFNKYLDSTIKTSEQKRAYDKIVRYLDSLDYEEIPYDVYKDYKEIFDFWTDDRLIEVEENKEKLKDNPSKFIEDNKESMRSYYEYINSEEYKTSNLYILNEHISKIFNSKEYKEIFIENLKVLSPEYKIYFDKMSNININVEKELFQ